MNNWITVSGSLPSTASKPPLPSSTTEHSQSNVNASIPVEAAIAPQKEKGKGRKKRTPAKQRQSVQVLEDAEFLDETDDGGMHWTKADFTCLARAWVVVSIQTTGRTKGFTFYQKINIAFNKDSECLTRRSSGSTKSQWYTLNVQCVAYKEIVAQQRFRNSSGKMEEDWKNDAHKIYQGLNDDNDFKHREVYKILAREPRWANLWDDGLNHAENIPRNVARRTSDNSSPRNSVGSNNLSDDLDGPPTPQSMGPNSDLDGSLYEGGSRPIGQKLYRKNLTIQKVLDSIATSGSGIQTMLDELRLEKRKTKKEKERRRAEAM
ncbi:hypothetical protein GIB67_009731 [Kingdonia uniflora]|uniref:No apical meristem-associated C-terminal domain-containing protein n=1 Tax=Kingdonia uniflora TaxID=39325 RepID=A0A7J7LBJ0_9MAGN|nr:hypothetical protein GIB67_009731 [Kingdonia uniflora]